MAWRRQCPPLHQRRMPCVLRLGMLYGTCAVPSGTPPPPPWLSGPGLMWPTSYPCFRLDGAPSWSRWARTHLRSGFALMTARGCCVKPLARLCVGSVCWLMDACKMRPLRRPCLARRAGWRRPCFLAPSPCIGGRPRITRQRRPLHLLVQREVGLAVLPWSTGCLVLGVMFAWTPPCGAGVMSVFRISR